MRILGLDYGEKRIGVAVSDPLGITAQGIAVITYSSRKEALQGVSRICREYDVTHIIVGLPLNMNGSPGPAARAAEDFARRLRLLLNLPVELVDERLTTRAAERTLIDGKVRRKARKKFKDKLAAVLILESFLSRRSATD